MDVKFDIIRIGKKRKNIAAEIILEQNVGLLKKSIRHFLNDENKKNDCVTMVIPAKGYNIKIVLQDFNDFYIRKILREEFPNSIYKGNIDKLLNYYN